MEYNILDKSAKRFVDNSIKCCDSRFGNLTSSYDYYCETNDIQYFIQCCVRFIYPVVHKFSRNSFEFEENLSISISKILQKVNEYKKEYGTNIGTYIIFLVRNTLINEYNKDKLKRIEFDTTIDLDSINKTCTNQSELLDNIAIKDREMLFDMYGVNRAELSNIEMELKYGRNYKTKISKIIKAIRANF